MKATTIKLEEPLLNQLYELIPEGKSLSKFVKEVLQREVLRNKMTNAALQYSRFLLENQDESDFLGEWEQADLASDPVKIEK